MGLAVSAREMLDAARALNNAETLDEANSFVTDAELLVVLNTELMELEDEIIASEDEPYNRGSSPITFEAGVSVYPLPVGGYKVTSVDIEWSASVRRTARRFTEAERNRFRGIQPSWSHFGKVWFRLLGGNIEFIPTPATAVTAHVNYTPSFTPLTDIDADVYDSQNGWHMAAVYGVAAYIAGKDDNDAKVAWCELQKNKQLARVRNMAASRIDGEPPRVQRTRRGYEDED